MQNQPPKNKPKISHKILSCNESQQKVQNYQRQLSQAPKQTRSMTCQSQTKDIYLQLINQLKQRISQLEKNSQKFEVEINFWKSQLEKSKQWSAAQINFWKSSLEKSEQTLQAEVKYWKDLSIDKENRITKLENINQDLRASLKQTSVEHDFLKNQITEIKQLKIAELCSSNLPKSQIAEKWILLAKRLSQIQVLKQYFSQQNCKNLSSQIQSIFKVQSQSFEEEKVQIMEELLAIQLQMSKNRTELPIISEIQK